MAVACPVCGSDIDWVTAQRAADVLGVSHTRVRQFLREGRLPGAVKYNPGGGIAPLWKIPITDVVALMESRRADKELHPWRSTSLNGETVTGLNP